MIITYMGCDFFKVQFADTVVAVNPISKQSKYKGARFGADVALVGINDPDHNGVEQVENAGKEPFVIWGPGEYEVKGVSVRGFLAKHGGEGAPLQSVYVLLLEDINLCFLNGGEGEDAEPDAPTKEALGEVDILFVPIGADAKAASRAYKRAVTLEPGIIIPAYNGSSPEALKTFLKEGGVEVAQPIEKLTVRKKNILGKEGEIVVLKQQG